MRESERLPKCVLTPAEAGKIIETPDTQTVPGYRGRAIASQQIHRHRQPPPELLGDLQR